MRNVHMENQDAQYFMVCSTASLAYLKASGGRLNEKDGLTRYGDSHVKDKTSWRPSYL